MAPPEITMNKDYIMMEAVYKISVLDLPNRCYRTLFICKKMYIVPRGEGKPGIRPRRDTHRFNHNRKYYTITRAVPATPTITIIAINHD